MFTSDTATTFEIETQRMDHRQGRFGTMLPRIVGPTLLQLSRSCAVSVGGLGSFHGTIGPLPSSSTCNGSAAVAMGPFGEIEIQNAFQAASASFDTTTGMLSFLDASKNDIGDWHFGGDASGLTLNMLAGAS